MSDFFEILKQIAARRRAENAQKAAHGAAKKPSVSARLTKKPAKASPVKAPKKAAAPKKSPTSKKKAALGAAHFLEFIYDGEAEWTLLAVRAPRKEVTDALQRLWKARHVSRGVAIKNVSAKNGPIAPFVAVIQTNDNPWTVIYRSLFWFAPTPDLFGPKGATQQLSKQFKAPAICLVSEDSSGALAYDLSEKGRVIESAEWSGESFESFKSTRREEPDLEGRSAEFVDELFSELGIYLPVCFPMSQGARSWLAVDAASAGKVKEADLLTI